MLLLVGPIVVPRPVVDVLTLVSLLSSALCSFPSSLPSSPLICSLCSLPLISPLSALHSHLSCPLSSLCYPLTFPVACRLSPFASPPLSSPPFSSHPLPSPALSSLLLSPQPCAGQECPRRCRTVSPAQQRCVAAALLPRPPPFDTHSIPSTAAAAAAAVAVAVAAMNRSPILLRSPPAPHSSSCSHDLLCLTLLHVPPPSLLLLDILLLSC